MFDKSKMSIDEILLEKGLLNIEQLKKVWGIQRETGKKIEDIAKIRKLSIDTIYGHLAHYIKNGEIEIYDIVKDKNKVDVLTNHFIDSHNYSFKYAKECLGDEFSYGEIKLVFSHLVFEGIIEDENEK